MDYLDVLTWIVVVGVIIFLLFIVGETVIDSMGQSTVKWKP